MTAEVAILNKIGVALATDSTVTVRTPQGDKTYNTANKLFTLSKFHPVGIMIWNGTELNAVPMELIIKEYRSSLRRRSKQTLVAYANDFIRFLTSHAHISTVDQRANFTHIIHDFSRSIRGRFHEEERMRRLPLSYPISGAARALFDDILNDFESDIRSAPKNINLRGITPALLERRYRGVTIAVGTLIAERPPHRSVRARFGHTAPTLGV